MADIFLSYQKRDRDLAERMAAALKAEGLSVWWDDDLTPRESWDRTIEREIAAADHVLVLWTKNSVESDWVRIEANYALTCRPSKLVQVRFDNAAVPMAFSMVQYLDLNRRSLSAGAEWPRLVAWVRLAEPSATRLADVIDPPKRRYSRPSAPFGVLVGPPLLLLAGIGLWYGDPWFSGSGPPPESLVIPEATPGAAKTDAGAAAGAQVSLIAIDTVWLRVTDGTGKKLYEAEMKPGERFDVPQDADHPRVRTARPDKVQVTLDGSNVPPLGEGAEAVDVEVSAAALRARGRPGAEVTPHPPQPIRR